MSTFACIDNHVYVARVVASGAFKVGLSSNVGQRLKKLRLSLGTVDLVVALRAPRFWTDALKLERRAHRLLASWRLGGELFAPECAHVIGSWIVAGRIVGRGGWRVTR